VLTNMVAYNLITTLVCRLVFWLEWCYIARVCLYRWDVFYLHGWEKLNNWLTYTRINFIVTIYKSRILKYNVRSFLTIMSVWVHLYKFKIVRNPHLEKKIMTKILLTPTIYKFSVIFVTNCVIFPKTNKICFKK
jgi:hypothetical protein